MARLILGRPGRFQRETLGGVVLWAHRGGGFEQPSNTAAAVAAFPECALETDVQATADLVADDPSTYYDGLIAFHDPVLDKVSNGHGLVRNASFGKLSTFDPAYYWTPGSISDRNASSFPCRGRFEKEPAYGFLRLVDLLKMAAGRLVSLDLKQPGMEQGVHHLLRETGMIENVVVQSFSDRRLDSFAKIAPEVSRGLGIRATVPILMIPFAVRRARGKCEFLAPPYRYGPYRLTRGMVDRAHRSGLGVHVWTVNDVSTAERLLAIGVDGVMTDQPSLIGPIVRQYNEANFDA